MGTLAETLAEGPVVLDGGLATELERRGHDLSTGLWSARLLRDDPAALVAVHTAFAAAGAQVITTASYQATLDGFARLGVDPDGTARLMARSVTLARAGLAAAGREGWVAGSVGPYGAMLADGSEYTGAYADPAWSGRTGGGLTVGDLRTFHHPRMALLAEAGADVLACETVPCLAEAEALVAELQELGVPGWLSLTVVTGPDGEVVTRRGEPAAEAFALAAGVDEVVAVGVNCTGPDDAGAAVGVAAAASGKPVVVYPNSGERWVSGKGWEGSAAFDPAEVVAWTRAGARLVGGCCRVGPVQISALAATVREAGGRSPAPGTAPPVRG